MNVISVANNTNRCIQKVNVKEGEQRHKNATHVARKVAQQLVEWLDADNLFKEFVSLIPCIGIGEIGNARATEPTDKGDEANSNNKCRSIPLRQSGLLATQDQWHVAFAFRTS